MCNRPKMQFLGAKLCSQKLIPFDPSLQVKHLEWSNNLPVGNIWMRFRIYSEASDQAKYQKPSSQCNQLKCYSLLPWSWYSLLAYHFYNFHLLPYPSFYFKSQNRMHSSYGLKYFYIWKIPLDLLLFRSLTTVLLIFCSLFLHSLFFYILWQ